MKKKFTVLLLYPYPAGVETYKIHIVAVSPKQAIFFARYEVSKKNENPEMKDDYQAIAVYLGHLEDLSA